MGENYFSPIETLINRWNIEFDIFAHLAEL